MGQINEWKQKCADLQGEVDKAQKDARVASSEVLKIRANFQDLEEKYDGCKKENRALAAEGQSMNEQLSDGGRSSVEVEKLQRKLGLENEELQLALEEAEGALEQEEAKLLKLQLEYTQLKQSTDRKYADKEDELDTSRKNHQRQLEALQATIDAELRTKSDMQRDCNRWSTMKYRDVTTHVMPPSVPTVAPMNSPSKPTNNASHWKPPNVPVRPPKARRWKPPTGWPNSKPCTTTPPTANERPRTTSTPSKRRWKSSRTKPRLLRTRPQEPWPKLPA